MLLSGSNFRSIAERDSLSWKANLSVSGSNTGRAVFGFSGDSKTKCFTLENGKITDPEKRFFAGYSIDVPIGVLSGNISGAQYDYYHQDVPYCLKGSGENFKPENFFVQTTGCALDTEFWVWSDPFNFELNYETGFLLSGDLTGTLRSVGADVSNKFKIFSGQVISPSDLFQVKGFESGNQTESTITINTTGAAATTSTGIRKYIKYPLRVAVYTNFGVVDKTFDVMALPESQVLVNFSLADLFSVGQEFSGVAERSGEYNLVYEASIDQGGILTGARDKPLYISLQYDGGKTGTYYQVSGIELTSSGEGYTDIPVAKFHGYSHGKGLSSDYSSASGEALMSFSIAGATITYSGKNYIANSVINVAGGGGVGAVVSGLTGDPSNPATAGKITGVKLIEAGSGYGKIPSMTFVGSTGADGELASGTLTLKSGFATGVKLTNSGLYHMNQPYFSGFSGGSPTSGATASITLTSYDKTFTGVWDLKTGYGVNSLVSYRGKSQVSGHRFDNKIPVQEELGYYWKDLRDACSINSGTVHLSYSFMNSGTQFFDTSTYTGSKTETIKDHYWESLGYTATVTTSEFTGEVGEAFREWKQLFETVFNGVTVEFKNLGFEGSSATGISSPWPVYDDDGNLVTGSYLSYSRAGMSGEAYNIGDFGGVLAYAFPPADYTGLGSSSEVGWHLGDIIFDSRDPWVLDGKDSDEEAGFSIKLVATHEIGHALGLKHSNQGPLAPSNSVNDLWPNESLMSPYAALSQRFVGDFSNGLKGAPLEKAAIKRLYSTGDDGGFYDYSNLNNMYVNFDPVYVTGNDFKIVLDYNIYKDVPAGFTTGTINDSESFPAEINFFTGVSSTGLFNKHIDVFGIPVLGTVKADNGKVAHAASVLAQYIDNNQDGIPDNSSVIDSLTGNKSVLLVTENEEEHTLTGSVFYPVWESSGFDPYTVYGSSFSPALAGVTYSSYHFDPAIETILHFVTSGGYAKVYSEVFGLQSGTTLANFADAARGGHFQSVPADNTYTNGKANGRYPSGSWFHSSDTGCDYACQVNQYFYWGITTLMDDLSALQVQAGGGVDLGVQSNRCSSITSEWEPCTTTKMQSTDPSLYYMLTSGVFSFPTIAPSGDYSGPTKSVRVIDRYPDNQKMSVSLNITGANDISTSFSYTGIGGPEVAVTGILTGVNTESGFYNINKRIRACPHDFAKISRLIRYTGDY